MGKRPERDVGQLVLAIEPWDKAASDEASMADRASDRPEASTGAQSLGAERKRKAYTLYDKVYRDDVVWGGWLQVERNRGAAGSDGMTTAAAQEQLRPLLRGLRRELREKRYRPRPVRRCVIPKPGGGQRELGIPCVRDRIVQTALVRVLEPIFERKFSDGSHGFRPNRGCQTALELVDGAVRDGCEWIVDADIKRFFDTVDHEKLLDAVNEEVADGSVLHLIRLFLKAGVLAGSEKLEVEAGTPQGGPLSPLLANIYLHPLDTALKAHGYGFVRYADDFVVFARTRAEAETALALIRQVLGDLGLELNEEKTRIAAISDGFEFLGFRYFRDPKGEVHKVVRRKSRAKFREAIRQRSKRHAGQKRRKPKSCTVKKLQRDERLRRMIREVNAYLVAWHAYFRQVWRAGQYDFRDLDGFMRRRIRSAIAGRYAKGRWQSDILPNSLLADLGLLSLQQLHNMHLAGARAPSGPD